MGFFDDYQEIGGQFMTAAEKQVLIDEGIPFQITAITEDARFDDKERFVVQVLVPDPENGEEQERLIGFQKNGVDSRDRMLKQMKEYLASDEAEPVIVKLEKVGRAQVLRNAAS